MDQGIGYDFAYGHGGEQRFRTANDAALLRRRYDGIDVVVHRHESHCVAMREIRPPQNLSVAASTVIHHESHCLARESLIDRAHVFGEQDGAKVQDVPSTTDIG